MEISQSRADRWFMRSFFIVLFGSVFFAFIRFVILKNYLVQAQTSCDPKTEECFVWQCDPESTVKGEACTGDPESDVSYYKIIKKKANTVPACNPDKDENCPPLTCASGEKDCTEILCNEENKVEQKAQCNDPEQYLKDNPPEETGNTVDNSDATDGTNTVDSVENSNNSSE